MPFEEAVATALLLLAQGMPRPAIRQRLCEYVDDATAYDAVRALALRTVWHVVITYTASALWKQYTYVKTICVEATDPDTALVAARARFPHARVRVESVRAA